MNNNRFVCQHYFFVAILLLAALRSGSLLANDSKFEAELKSRDLTSEYLVVADKTTGGYGVSEEDLWNPNAITYNATEWYNESPEDDARFGVKWTVVVPDDKTKEYVLFINYKIIGKPCKWSLSDDSGKEIESGWVEGQITADAQISEISLKIPASGAYTIEYMQEKNFVSGFVGGRVSNFAYFKPVATKR